MRPLALAAVLLAGCSSKKAPPAADAAITAALPPDLARGPDLFQQTLVEVEVMGTVSAPKAPAGKILVVLTDGPCFQLGSHYVGTQPVPKPGQRYFIEVFPPEGTDLWACAVLVVGGNRTTPWVGRAKRSPLRAKGHGEVIFDPIDIEITKGAPVNVPTGLHLE